MKALVHRPAASLSCAGRQDAGAVEFRDRRPVRIHSLSLIAALDPDRAPQTERIETALREFVAEAVFADEEIPLDDDTAIFVNPGGPFYIGGPSLHAGLTGRKNGIDTYGEFARLAAYGQVGRLDIGLPWERTDIVEQLVE